MSKDLASNYNCDRVAYDAPIASSDHQMVTCAPDHDTTPVSITRWHKMYDFRHSHIARLHEQMSQIDWNFLLSPHSDVNEQCSTFHNCLTSLLNLCIPTRMIPLTDKDKDWMTPITKMLIMDRWTAFRRRNWPLYNHLKHKAKEEIAKSKTIWAEKLMRTSNGLWKLVSKQRRVQCGGLSSLVDEFGSESNLLHSLATHLRVTIHANNHLLLSPRS